MGKLPHTGLLPTDSRDPATFVTDSAAAAAWASGQKTYNRVISPEGHCDFYASVVDPADDDSQGAQTLGAQQEGFSVFVGEEAGSLPPFKPLAWRGARGERLGARGERPESRRSPGHPGV